MDPALRRALLAGPLAGAVGFATFFVIHAAWIVPIWDVLGFGLGFALVGGASVGWAFHEARARLPPGPAGYAAFGGLLLLTMVPAEVAVLVRGPIPIVTFANAPATWVGYLLGELLVSAALVGGGVGWALTRSRRGLVAWTLAGALYGWTVGHNIPFLGAGETLPVVAVLVVAPTAAAVVAFGALQALAAHRARVGG